MTSVKTTSHRSRRSWLLAGLAGLVLVLSGCAEDAPLDTLEPEGPAARTIQDLVGPVFLIAGVVFVLVEVGVLVIAWRFRQRKGDDDSVVPTQTHGNTPLELGWTILPAVILAFVAVFTLVTIFELEKRDDDAVDINVVGNQWWWQFNYDVDDDGEFDFSTATEMVIPAGRQVNLSIESNDVIHSFWIPRLNGKRDAVPGRTHTLSMESDEPGYFFGQCTEFCGLSHGVMRMRVIALPQDEYDAWLEEQAQDVGEPETASQARGREAFEANCASCHSIRGLETQPGDVNPVPLVAGVAPDLTHFASRRSYAGGIFELYDENGDVNRGQLEAWLRNPPAEKPMAPEDQRGMPNLNLTENQIDDLVEYLLSTADRPVWTGPRND
ncbi:cytochrome c oxidase subunit II [Actinomarinicola tropica]|uniref:Cytochrome c oxidase subunit 2 n=1 Tax=Actinomarinicola tropica TaxID=2789776 RepID=A0A5Q2RQL6_9ACTN|nr:cytochrome c oxidase subunit II [Actinomarinicola tropica]